MLGVQSALGLAFTADEQQPGRDQIVVLTDALWRSRYGADPAILGRTIRIDGDSQTVIGVMPANFASAFLWPLGPGQPGGDPLVLAGTVVLLLAMALGACIIPVRRAAKVDPLIALRAE